jgi:hypothetical protein
MTNHSKAPWKRARRGNDTFTIVSEAGDEVAQALPMSRGGRGRPPKHREYEREANAALIEAAPELLTLLKLARDCVPVGSPLRVQIENTIERTESGTQLGS